MKLNLLPTNVAKSGQSATALIAGIAIGLLSIVAAVLGIVMSKGAMEAAKAEAQTHQQGAADALATANAAQDQIALATVITSNQKLAEAMDAHNGKVIDLFNKVRRYVPAYYRLDTIGAQPSGTQATVTMTGQLQSFTQYADLAIALWKIPGAINVTRQGYVVDTAQVPALTEADQTGAPIKADETPLPTDPLERMNALIARAAAAPQGFLNVSGYGSGDNLTAKGPMPGWSTVTMTVLIDENIQVPNPRATITAAGAAGPTGAPTAGFNTAGAGGGR